MNDQLYAEGICALAVQVGPDQPLQVQVLGAVLDDDEMSMLGG